VEGRATAQAVSRWIPTVAAWVRSGVRSHDIYGRQSVAEALLFPLTILIPPTLPRSSIVIRARSSGRRTN
jgi:hypothetical protein